MMTKKTYKQFVMNINRHSQIPLQFQEQGLKNNDKNIAILKDVMLWTIGEVCEADNPKFSWDKWAEAIFPNVAHNARIEGKKKPYYCICEKGLSYHDKPNCPRLIKANEKYANGR